MIEAWTSRVKVIGSSLLIRTDTNIADPVRLVFTASTARSSRSVTAVGTHSTASHSHHECKGRGGTRPYRLARRTTSGSTLSTCSTSSSVDSRPSEKRTNALASCFSTPNALITWDGSSEPAEQAEPLEAQMPSISNPANNAMLSEPRTRNETVFGRRPSRGPANCAPSTRSIRPAKRLVKGQSLYTGTTGSPTNSPTAPPKPTNTATP